jgi:endonuclease/exonuclease/phosphatase family metal-dependent hydrolase
VTEAPGVKPAPGPDQPPIPVRLVTLDVRYDPSRLVEVLAAADADVVCLPQAEQPLELSRALDMQLAWEPATDGPVQSGHALLSRLPILISDLHPLPGAGTALRTMVELDGAALWVTTTQLAPGRADERAAQAAALAALHTESMETGVLVGNFGTEADASDLVPLLERFTEVGRSSRGDQVWVSAGIEVTATADPPLVVDLAVRSGV